MEHFPNFPFLYIDLSGPKVAEKIMSRSILIHMIMEIFSEGKTFDKIFENMNLEKLKPYIESTDTFKFKV